jgi:hypothetical protein
MVFFPRFELGQHVTLYHFALAAAFARGSMKVATAALNVQAWVLAASAAD